MTFSQSPFLYLPISGVIFHVNLIQKQFSPHNNKTKTQFKIPPSQERIHIRHKPYNVRKALTPIFVFPQPVFRRPSPLDLFPPAFLFISPPAPAQPPAYLPTFTIFTPSYSAAGSKQSFPLYNSHSWKFATAIYRHTKKYIVTNCSEVA